MALTTSLADIPTALLFGMQRFYIPLIPIAANLSLPFVILLFAWHIVRTPPIGSNRLRVLQLLVLVLCASFRFLGGYATGGRLSDIGNKLFVEQRVSLPELQDWSMQTLRDWDETSPTLFEYSPRQFSAAVPIRIQQLVGDGNNLSVSGSFGEGRCIFIGYGGGFHHWGVLVGPPSFAPSPSSSRRFYKWRDGVYGFQGP